MSDQTKLDKLVSARAEKLQELQTKLDELSTELNAKKTSTTQTPFVRCGSSSLK